MQTIKISFLFNYDMRNTLILELFKILSKKKIEIVPLEHCDILIFGPYDTYSIKRKFLNFIKKKIKKIESYFPNIDFYLINRKIKPLKIFHTFENYYPTISVKFDFAITSYLGIDNENHLRFPIWKEHINWAHLGVKKDLSDGTKRFGSFHEIKDFMRPQGNTFLNKDRKICLITSHLNEPRKSMYEIFSKKFTVDGYGPYFDGQISNHNLSNFTKKNILEKYAFNLCPENNLYPGYYSEKIPDAFMGKCLPISWADSNINYDFNENSFINLLNYSKNNYEEVCNLLKDDNFLKKYTDQPLLLKEPTLNDEINFISKIINTL
jgi:hypothetical protein